MLELELMLLCCRLSVCCCWYADLVASVALCVVVIMFDVAAFAAACGIHKNARIYCNSASRSHLTGIQF